MKPLPLLLCILVACSLGVTAQFTENSPNFRVTLLNQDPDPVEPGQIVEVRFKIENFGAETTEDVIVELIPSYPLSMYSGGPSRNIGQMQGIQTGADAVIVDYKLRVDDNAVEADTELELRVKVGARAYQVYDDKEFLIDVQTHDAILSVEQLDIETQHISPGEVGTVRMVLKNFADSLIKEVTVTLDLEDTPFAPYKSTAERQVYQIKSDYQMPITYDLIAKPDALGGVYTIPFTITYTDERGTTYTKNDVLSLAVGGAPELSAYIKETTLQQKGQRGTITVELANRGATNVKFLQLTLQPSDSFEILSSTNTIYIGDVDSDDIETEDFELFVNEDGLIFVPILIEYKDANNKPYAQELNLPLRIYSGSELSQYGLKETPIVTILIVLAILALIGYYAYRKLRKKK